MKCANYLYIIYFINRLSCSNYSIFNRLKNRHIIVYCFVCQGGVFYITHLMYFQRSCREVMCRNKFRYIVQQIPLSLHTPAAIIARQQIGSTINCCPR